MVSMDAHVMSLLTEINKNNHKWSKIVNMSLNVAAKLWECTQIIARWLLTYGHRYTVRRMWCSSSNCHIVTRWESEPL